MIEILYNVLVSALEGVIIGGITVLFVRYTTKSMIKAFSKDREISERIGNIIYYAVKDAINKLSNDKELVEGDKITMIVYNGIKNGIVKAANDEEVKKNLIKLIKSFFMPGGHQA